MAGNRYSVDLLSAILSSKLWPLFSATKRSWKITGQTMRSTQTTGRVTKTKLIQAESTVRQDADHNKPGVVNGSQATTTKKKTNVLADNTIPKRKSRLPKCLGFRAI